MAFMFLREMVRTYRERDPAARSSLEVLLCYPGVHAVMWHKLSHALWRARLHCSRPLLVPYRALAHRHRDPSRGEARAGGW